MAFLTITNLNKTFGNSAAVKDFNLQVDKGELVSFLGPSGCGKTTTLRMIAGFEIPSSGCILMEDKEITYKPPAQRNVGMVFQAYALFPNLTIAKNIAFGLEIARFRKEEIKERVKEMLDLIHMPDFGERYPYQLSGGQQQRVALARALAVRPQVLLLDEPLSALDAKIRVSLRTEIRAIQKKLGITAIYVTHDQEEALSMSDRVVVMNNGEIEQVGEPFEIYNSPQTAFVAQFVGTLNILQAEVSDAGSGTILIDGQQIQTNGPIQGAREGEIMTIALRPELLSLDTETGGANILNSVIENIIFLGSIVRLTLNLGGRSIYMDTFNNPHMRIPKIGDQVRVACSQDSILILNSA